MKTKKRFHKLTAWLLTLAMLMTLMPMSAFAVEMSPHSHPICGAAHTNIGDHTDPCEEVKWTAWDGTDKDGETDGIQLTAGSWYLTDNVNLTETLTISSGTVNLCLNGKTITNRKNITVSSGATLNICACGSGGTVKAIVNSDGNITNNGTVNVYGGTVQGSGSGNTVKGSGIDNYGTVNVYGGTVKAPHGQGHGIYNEAKGTANIYGGTVSSGSSEGILNKKYFTSGIVNVYGGTVIGATNGITNNGILNLSGGSVGNLDGNYGISNNGTLNLSGVPTITGTWADIYLNSDKLITIGEGGLTYTSDKAISVRMNTPGTFTSGWTTKMGENAANYDRYFTSANDGYIVQPDGNNELELAEPPTSYTVTYNGNGATSGDVPADSNSPYISGSTVTVLGNTGNLAKTGYAFVGWNTWSSGYGTDYAPGDTFNINSNTTLYAQWEEYEITTQPTESTPAVSTNADSDIASYQWYKGTMSEVTDTADGVSAYTEDTLTSSYSDGWWTCHEAGGYSTPGYFNIALNAGDSILAQTSATISEGQLGIWAAYEKQDWDWTTPDDHFLVTAPADGNYDLHVSDVTYGGGTQPTVKAQVFHIGSTPADGATSKTLEADEDGWYACKITYKDGTVLYSGPVEYEAPSIPVTGVTLDKNSINLYLGKTDNATLTASVEPDNATNKAVTWTTDDMAVATVDQNGVVTAVGKGYTKITATAADGSGVSDSLYVYVNDKIESVVINVVAPVVGNTINGNNFSVDASQPYYIHRTSWNETLNNDDTNVTVEAGQNYKMKVVLAGNYGYFDDNTTASIKVGDDIIKEGVVLTASATPSTCSVEYIFNIPALEYTVTFNSNGGSAISDQTVDNGGKVEEPTAPTKAGYTFAGWYKDSGLATAWDFDTDTVTEPTILYAKWTAKAEVIINTDVQNYTYDKSAKAFEIRETDLTGFTITYEQNGQDVTPQNAGFYDVVLSREEDDTYKAYSETLVNGLIINKVVVDEPEVGTKLYSGSLQTADITGTDIYEVTENNGGTNVGEYDVILTLKDTTNYKWKLAENSGATATRKFYITFTENTWEEEPQITGWTFGQELNEPTFDAKFGDVVVEYKKDSEDESEYTETVPTNAGNYNVRFTVMGNANFGGLSKVIDLSIAKAIPSLEAPTAQNGITYGAKLNTVELPDGWTWLDGTTIPTVQNSGFAAYFTPDDTENYDWTVINGWDATESRVERTVAVTVTKNNPSYTAPTGLTATYGQTLADVQLTEGWNWKAPTTSVGNAGTNTFAAVFTPVDTDNYNTVEVDLTITVARQKVAKPAENVTVFTYNSNEQIYTLTEDARYEITNNKRTDAGNQTVTIALKDSANYEWADGSVDDVEYTFTIAKATADIAVDTAPIVKTYGEALTLPTATSTFGIPVCDKTVAQLSDVGSYEVTYSVAETPNYYGDTETLSVTINPAIISKPTADNTEFVYNGLMQTYSVSSNSNYTVSENTRTDAGEQTVTVTLTDKHNYRWDDNSTDDVTFTFTIAQKEIGIEWGTTQFTYNKTEQKPTATATGLVAGDSCIITVTGGQINAGNGYVATAESLSNENYKLPASKTTTFNIAQKPVTITGVTIEATKVYDRDTDATITNYGTVSNVIDGDNVTVNTVSATATYNDKNVGNGKSVTFTGFAITGADAANYVLSGQPENQSANITPKSVTITGVTAAVTKIYDANTTATIENNGSVDDVISGDTVNVNTEGATASYADANVGTDKAVTFAGFAISGADASNYELSAQPASTTANITAKDIAGAEITLGEALTYNETEQTQTIASATVGGLTITYDVSDNVNTDAGDYTLTITGNGNFEGTAQKAYIIAKADATLGTAPSAITPLTYNTAEQTLVNTGENVVGGTLMYKLSEGEYSAELPKATNAGTYTVYYKVMGDSNHNHTAEQNFTVTIAEKVVSPVVVLTAPASNQTPVTSIETDEYTATVTWSPDVTDKFAYSTDYTATVTITPKANYTLTGIRENEYAIEGATVTNSADSSVVTAVFPKTNSRPSGGGGSSVTRYTVKFDTNGGSSVSSATVTKNAKVAEPKTPEKDGYTFGGWYTDKEFAEKYDFESKVTKNFTLYAKWDKHDDEQSSTDTHNCPSLAFDDLDITKWYHFDTDYVIENGIFKGTTETTFEPDSAQTRAMMVTVLYRVEGEPAVNKSIPFADVDMGAYYANAVIWGQQNGIIKGYSKTEFGPDDKITREQIAAIMHRYAQYKGYDISVGENTNILSYDDFDSISEYAIPSMQWAVGSGLIKGKSESTLNPLDNATRAEIAAILHRFIEANK